MCGSMGDKFLAALREYDGKIRTFARNSAYALPGYDVEDVEQELRVVLWQCCEKYDPSKGARFNTYFQQIAINRIRDLIRKSQTEKRVGDKMLVSLDRDDVAVAVSHEIAALRIFTTDMSSAEDHALARITLWERGVCLEDVNSGRRAVPMAV